MVWLTVLMLGIATVAQSCSDDDKNEGPALSLIHI